MIQNYSYSNLEAMINSIYSNAEIIQKMLKSVKEQETEITYKMQSYAKVKKTISEDKIDLYRDYVSNKVLFPVYIPLRSLQICKTDADYSKLHAVFDRINSIQIKVMELLCNLLCKANRIVATF